MARRILDSNRLINSWRRHRPRNRSAARRLASEMTAVHGTNAIVTPVAIEFLGGTHDRDELQLAREFLSCLDIVDDGRVLPEDLVRARALAERIPHGGQARGFADCLIRAIADRLHYEVDTADTGMPRISSPLPSSQKQKSHRPRKRRER
jgi:predicted nucleic acid-binding protein